MKKIKTQQIIEVVKTMCIEANCILGEDIVAALTKTLTLEKSPMGKEIIKQLIENSRIAKEEKMPLCQDTGFTVIFLEIGQEVQIMGGDLDQAINEGVRQGYQEGCLRKSIVSDPFRRKNTGDNTPAVIHTTIVPGDRLKIVVAPKGAGSENMSEIRMLLPSEGLKGVENFVVDRVNRSGGNPCPPIIVGVGIGGTFEKCALLAKQALLRPLGTRNTDPFYADLEKNLLKKINNLGIGPMGLGGQITALEVFVDAHPCHIASLPVAVNIQCHSARHKEAIL
ncbi:MAG: fumarate hydratase [Candidatus Omnitrophica bacterium]|nr:fumarate hydratase [Candidatus Omnitrophota bacterium]